MQLPIPLVALTEYPVVAAWGGQLFASRGTRFDWPDEQIEANRLRTDYASFYANLIAERGGDDLRFDPCGRVAIRHVHESRTLVVGSLPRHLSKGKSSESKSVKRFLGAAPVLFRMIAENAANHLVRQTAVHGIVNYNARILSACEVALGIKESKYLIDIQKACYQISSLVEAARVFSPDWEAKIPNQWSSIHEVVFMLNKVWGADLFERHIRVEIDQCYKKVGIDGGILSAVLGNMFSNIIKYVKPRTDVEVQFLTMGDEFLVAFGMTSRFIDSNDAERLTLLGARGRDLKERGDGVGLALIRQALEKYGGRLLIEPGEAIPEDPAYGQNVFSLCIPVRLVREAQGPASVPHR